MSKVRLTQPMEDVLSFVRDRHIFTNRNGFDMFEVEWLIVSDYFKDPNLPHLNLIKLQYDDIVFIVDSSYIKH